MTKIHSPQAQSLPNADISTASSKSAGRFFTLSNILSISRALLAIPFALVMLSSIPFNRLWGGVIMAVAALTDKLDGVFARRFHETTEWGKILDPLADKIAVGVVGVVLLFLDRIPLWFVLAVIGRDVVIFVGGMYLKNRRGIVLQSNEIGKWAVGVLALTLFLMVIGVEGVTTHVLIGATLIMLALSLALYVGRFVEVMNAPQSAAK